MGGFHLFNSDLAILHVDGRDTSTNKKDIQALTMAFRLPYFLVYQNKTATAESVKPSSVSTHTGQPVLQVDMFCVQ